METKSWTAASLVLLLVLVVLLGFAMKEKSQSRANYHIDLTLHGYIVTNDSGLDTTISIGELEEFFINDNL